MNIYLVALAGVLSGFAGSLGVGGGGILIIFLTSFFEVSQRNAQGINLLFFLPIAIVSVIIYTKRKLIKIKPLLPLIALGILGAISGTFLSGYISQDMLSKIFGGGLIAIGLRELFSKGA